VRDVRLHRRLADEELLCDLRSKAARDVLQHLELAVGQLADLGAGVRAASGGLRTNSSITRFVIDGASSVP
jgi:hypothetical protein